MEPVERECGNFQGLGFGNKRADLQAEGGDNGSQNNF